MWVRSTKKARATRRDFLKSSLEFSSRSSHQDFLLEAVVNFITRLSKKGVWASNCLSRATKSFFNFQWNVNRQTFPSNDGFRDFPQETWFERIKTLEKEFTSQINNWTTAGKLFCGTSWFVAVEWGGKVVLVSPEKKLKCSGSRSLHSVSKLRLIATTREHLRSEKSISKYWRVPKQFEDENLFSDFASLHCVNTKSFKQINTGLR